MDIVISTSHCKQLLKKKIYIYIPMFNELIVFISFSTAVAISSGQLPYNL